MCVEMYTFFNICTSHVWRPSSLPDVQYIVNRGRVILVWIMYLTVVERVEVKGAI